MVRIKERYLLVNILYPRDDIYSSTGVDDDLPDFVAIRRGTQSELTPQLLLRGIKAEAHALFGDCGAGALERTLSVKYFSMPMSTFILRITREHLRYVWTALTFMRQVPVRNGRPCIFRVARVGGTIRKVEEEAIRQARTIAVATEAYMAGKTTSAFELLMRATTAEALVISQKKDYIGDVVSGGKDGITDESEREEDGFGEDVSQEDGETGENDNGSGDRPS